MPVANGFGLEVLVGGRPLPEYIKDEKFYVESDLNDHEYSKLRILSQEKYGEMIEQAWPVTPFQIRVWLHKSRAQHKKTGLHCVYINVDGSPVNSVVLNVGESRLFEGFVEVQGDKEIVREYCFSLPRYVKNQDDKLEAWRLSQVGTIRAKFYSTQIKPRSGHNCKPYWRSPYVQANKRDAQTSAAGSYTPCTVMQGQVVKEGPTRTPSKRSYFADTLLCDLVIHYRTGHDLIEMGLKEAPAIVQQNAGTAQTDALKTEVSEKSPVKSEPVTETVKQGQQTTVKDENENDVKPCTDEEGKEFKANILRNASFLAPNTSRDVINMAAFTQAMTAAAAAGSDDVTKTVSQVSLDLSSIDVKPPPCKLEPSHGIITLDSEVTSQTDDDDVIEVTHDFVVINEEEEVCVVEDLVGPEVLQLD